ncbi:MAG: rhodanese-like domain-containing protein [Gammaproteobacteria bacterium]|nr:rhodanese-like domain-containing protein [Gammaproteobacteria bacterium]
MKTFDQLVADASKGIQEWMPWDLQSALEQAPDLLMIDVREADEFQRMHIKGSLSIPRGILEAASEYGFDETEPRLADARAQQVIVICRSGRRSCLAADTLKQLGFAQAISLKTGLRGWNDADAELIDEQQNLLDGDVAEVYLAPKVVAP